MKAIGEMMNLVGKVEYIIVTQLHFNISLITMISLIYKISGFTMMVNLRMMRKTGRDILN
jgi:hypothetical protein